MSLYHEGQTLLVTFLPKVTLRARKWPHSLNFEVQELRKYPEFRIPQKSKSS